MDETKEILLAIKHAAEMNSADLKALRDQQDHMYKDINEIKNEQQHIKREVRSINRSI